MIWCNTHQRPATSWCDIDRKWECDPMLSGIMMPCFVVDLEGEAEIIFDEDVDD